MVGFYDTLPPTGSAPYRLHGACSKKPLSELHHESKLLWLYPFPLFMCLFSEIASQEQRESCLRGPRESSPPRTQSGDSWLSRSLFQREMLMINSALSLPLSLTRQTENFRPKLLQNLKTTEPRMYLLSCLLILLSNSPGIFSPLCSLHPR